MKRPLMGMGIALVAGAAAVWAEMPLLCVCFGALAALLYLKFRTDSSWKYILGLSVFLIVGFCRTMAAEQRAVPLEEDVCGRLYKIQDKEKSRYLFLKTENGKVLVIETGEEEIRQPLYKGQILAVRGKAEYFEPPGNPGQFDEKNYYRSQGIAYRVWADGVEVLSEGRMFFRKLRILEKLRTAISGVYTETMGPSGAAVLRAAVLGDRSEFRGDLRRYYQENGWLHLVTVSGLHLSFIAMGFYRRLRRWGVSMDLSVLLASVLMAAYGYMTDLGDSMLRAMGMMGLTLGAELSGRKTDLMTSLVFTGAVMVFLRPERLLSSGFLLSFGAVGGMAFGKWLWTSLQNGENIQGIQMKAGYALCIQSGIFLTTLPLVLWNMFEIPVIGMGYNFFMIPLVSVLIPAAFTAGLAGVCGLPLISGAAALILKAADGILAGVHRLPSMTWVCGKPEGWQVLLYIFCILGWAFLRKRKKKISGRLLLASGCLILLILRLPADRIICMDVGQGDGICIMTEEGQTLFIDGGSSDVKALFQYRLEPLMKYYGLRKIDLWLLTHGDEDHISGIREALEEGRAEIEKIAFPDIDGDEALENIEILAKKRGISVVRLLRGDEFEAGNFHFDCLHPVGTAVGGDKNNTSLVLALRRELRERLTEAEASDFTMLLMGDAEGESEAEMLKRGDLSGCHILKAGHHGSAGASTEAFLEAVCPEWALISCGEKNRYGHPAEETLKRLEGAGCRWLTTARYGALTVEFGNGRYFIYGYKNND